MSQLVPVGLLILILISPVYAAEPFEALCTSEQDFQTDAIATYACVGTDAQACTDAGGEYNGKNGDADGKCENIDTLTPDKCGKITGFIYEPDSTCGQMGLFLSIPEYATALLDCSNPAVLPLISQAQSTCCGGTDNQKDICADAPKPYETICTSEQDFQTDVVVSYACKGTNAQACTDAGGKYNVDEGKCEDIDIDSPDACGKITGFTYEPDATCGQIGFYLSIPEYATASLDCSNPFIVNFGIPSFQSTCCGGTNNNKDICPNAPTITSADVCNQCDKNREEDGVPTDCFNTVLMLVQGGYTIADAEACGDGAPENNSLVNVECKAAVLASFDCGPPVASPVTSPVASPVTSPVASPEPNGIPSIASDISIVIAAIISTALFMS